MTQTANCACHASARVWYDEDCECVQECLCGGAYSGAEFAGQPDTEIEDILSRELQREARIQINEKVRALVKRCLKSGMITAAKPEQRPRIVITPHRIESWEASVPGYWGRMVWDRTGNPISESDVCGLAIQAAPADTIGPVFLWVSEKWTVNHASTP